MYPFFDAISCAVENAIPFTFSGMNTAPASAAASAAFCMRAPSRFQLPEVDRPGGEPEDHHQEHRRPDQDDAAFVVAAPRRADRSNGRHGTPQTDVGTGSKRNTEWSVSVTFGAEQARHELVVELHVHADLVVRLGADLVRRCRPAAALGLPVSNACVLGFQMYLMQFAAHDEKLVPEPG